MLILLYKCVRNVTYHVKPVTDLIVTNVFYVTQIISKVMDYVLKNVKIILLQMLLLGHVTHAIVVV